MKTLENILAAGVLLLFMAAGGERMFAGEDTPNKIKLLILDVGTIDTVGQTEKLLESVGLATLLEPALPAPPAALESPELRRQAARVNWQTGLVEYYQTREDIQAVVQCRRKMLEALETCISADQDNRMAALAKDFIAAGLAMEPYANCIQVVDRSADSLAEIEQAIADKRQEEVAPATLFLTVTLADQKETTTTVPMGGTTVSKTTYSRRAVASVRDLDNVRIYSFNVTAERTFRHVGTTQVAGQDPADELIIDLMEQIATKVGDFFVEDYIVNLVIPEELAGKVFAYDFRVFLDREEEGSILVVPGQPFTALALQHLVLLVPRTNKFNPDETTVDPQNTQAAFTISAD
ncbi:MAG: hypothetical protein II943_11650 [Victivallales bacterium]|nr:hypothetical protein [Victivallales bacterium]